MQTNGVYCSDPEANALPWLHVTRTGELATVNTSALGAVRDPTRSSGFSRQFWTSSVTQSVSFASVTGGRVRHSRDPVLRV
jgi:hypothetical protein